MFLLIETIYKAYIKKEHLCQKKKNLQTYTVYETVKSIKSTTVIASSEKEAIDFAENDYCQQKWRDVSDNISEFNAEEGKQS